MTTDAPPPPPTAPAGRTFVNWPGSDPASAHFAVRDDRLPRRGDVLGEVYRVEARAGDGAMPAAYRARDPDDVPVLLHVMLHPRPDDESFDRFADQARSLRELHHTCIGAIHELGRTSGGDTYFVSDYRDAEDLQHRLTRRGPMAWTELGPLILQVCGALHAAHGRGIIHGDVKPSNIFVHADNDVELYNFGLYASSTAERRRLLAPTGSVLGTIEFLSPEAWRGLPLDERTDVYTLGMTLYQLTSGYLPTDYDPSRARVPGKPYRTLPEAVPAAVQELVYHCIETDPSRRFPSVLELIAALEPTLPRGRATAHARDRAGTSPAPRRGLGHLASAAARRMRSWFASADSRAVLRPTDAPGPAAQADGGSFGSPAEAPAGPSSRSMRRARLDLTTDRDEE